MFRFCATLAAMHAAAAQQCVCELPDPGNNGSKPIDILPLGHQTFKARQNWEGNPPEDKDYDWDLHFDCVADFLKQTGPGEKPKDFDKCDVVSAQPNGLIINVQSSQDMGSAAEITLICDPEGPADSVVWPYKAGSTNPAEQVTVSGVPPSLSYQLQGTTRCACAGGCSGGAPISDLSAEPVFFLVCLIGGIIGVALYLGIGVAIGFKQGKRGAELIPNVSFWVSFPSYVVEGALFICGGACRKAEGYESK